MSRYSTTSGDAIRATFAAGMAHRTVTLHHLAYSMGEPLGMDPGEVNEFMKLIARDVLGIPADPVTELTDAQRIKVRQSVIVADILAQYSGQY